MKLKILKNDHYIDIINECDFQEGSKAFTASCFLNKNIEGEFKDFSLTQENESIAKVLLCSFEMLEVINEIIKAIKKEDIIIKDNTDNDGFETRGFYFYNKLNSLIKKATE